MLQKNVHENHLSVAGFAPAAVATIFLLAVMFFLGATIFFAAGALADDRDLLREASADPYVFILFDTSGSMHWAPQCTQAQFDAGICDYLCPSGDCFVPQSGDDAASKFAQAKEALYEVLQQVDGIHFGFATYNQDDLVMADKHWIYRVSDDPKPDASDNFLTLVNGDRFPQDVALHCTQSGVTCTSDADCGARGGVCVYDDVFGATWPCSESGTNGNNGRKACFGSTDNVADMDDYWELRRAQRLPKLGRGPEFSSVRTPGTFEDEFDSDSFSNNDGSYNWAGPWIEGSDFGGATGGNAQISGGRLRLDDYPNNSGLPSLERELDLSGFGSAELSFDFEVVGDIENQDDASIDVSSDGGSSWTTLENFDGESNPYSGSRSYDISNWISSNTRIRFRIRDQFRGDDEQFQVDNLVIRGGPPQTVVYLRNNNNDNSRRYKLIYRPLPTLLDGITVNRYGNPKLAVEVEVRECTNNANDCTSSFVDRETIYYDLVDEYASWDNGADRGPSTLGFYNQSSAGDGDAGNTCDGWDDNDDTGSDTYPNSSGYNLRFPNDPATPIKRFDLDGDGTAETDDFLVGDMIPLDWAVNNKQKILQRLAPNTAVDPLATPDFGVASYFQDERLTGEDFLRLKDERARPLVSDGSTPLGNSIKDFRTWYNGCAQGSCSGTTGWEDIAALFDRDFNCRKKFLMVLTDGDNTCNGPSACSGTASLRAQTGIKTFVVAFGVQGGGNTLTCMANNGGTGEPIYPQNKQELIDALLDLFANIKVESRAFASASVPTLANETSDKIVLSSFTPLPKQSIWPGRLNAFRSPLPLKDDNTPDFDRDCVSNQLQAACHLWDAALQLRLNQAPTQSDVDAGNYKIGPSANERRVLYSKEPVVGRLPRDLRLFVPPSASSPEEADLFSGLDLSVPLASAQSEIERIIADTVKIKDVTVNDADGNPQNFLFVMGDIFHADPQVVGSPVNQIYYRQDLNGFREYSDRHIWRRRMLTVGANDGQLHFFDAGQRAVLYDREREVYVERFTDGTGKELFAYIPRLVLPIVRDQAGGENHIYSLDGVPVIGDVYIDPLYGGSDGPLNPDDREWRTVLVSGLREGGDVFRQANPVRGFFSGYFALDITQPDELVTPAATLENPDPLPVPVPASGQAPFVPTCMSLSGADLQGSTKCKTTGGEAYPFPAELWSFTDSVVVDVDLDGDGTSQLETLYLDEEANTEHDLGDTWSKPVIGRIRICGGAVCDPLAAVNDLEDRYVAIVGGGIDPRFPNTAQRGSWLYMLDMETGQAIYKRQLDSAAPSEPVVLDIDRDGVFDRIYIATTGGKVFKVDLTALSSTGDVPGLASVAIDETDLLDENGDPVTAPVNLLLERIVDPAWEPFEIFDTGGRPIYMTPSAFLVPSLDQFALAFGTGNRWNLWDFTGVTGRFYTFVDQDFTPATTGLPRTEATLKAIDLTSITLAGEDTSYLEDFGGWYIPLEPDEKVITQAFVLVGVMVFTSFDPRESVDLDGDGFVDACARSGVSRAFVVNAENADPFVDLNTETTGLERYHEEGDFTTAPYVDNTSTKNPDAQGKTTDSDLDPTQLALQESIRQALMRFFPESCHYNKSYSLTVNASRSDTGHVRYATIPVAMCPLEWKEN